MLFLIRLKWYYLLVRPVGHAVEITNHSLWVVHLFRPRLLPFLDVVDQLLVHAAFASLAKVQVAPCKLTFKRL